MNVDTYNRRELEDCLHRVSLDLMTDKRPQSSVINRLIFQLEQYVLQGEPRANKTQQLNRTGT